MKQRAVVFLLFVLFLGCAKDNKQSTISVIGLGSVLAQPDTLQLSISLSNVAPTIREAHEKVALMVRRALEILKEEGIEEKNTATSSLRFNQEYEWQDNKRILIGRRAEQTITFSINDIQKDNAKAPRLLDKMTEIDSIVLNEISFSIKDTRDLFIRSRELAYQKAMEKALQYAQLSGLSIVKTSSITEMGSPQVPVMSNSLYNQAAAQSAAADLSGTTVLPTGELEITSQILVEFLLE
ncbi:MAG: SIMPL domain-containing protein [Spirochaetaceae bacterium]|nr:SIMPL domain-containing protein [Spirochaetaceae bacterium]